MVTLLRKEVVSFGGISTTADYAAKLQISRSAFFRLIDYIQSEYDTPIRYDRHFRQYEYCKGGVMFFGFLPVEYLNDAGLKKINGGAISYIESTNLEIDYSPVPDNGTASK